ncbi:chloramphenicol acetyltransferase [Paraglaciecola arctica]|uniref:Chloramphenicol O-acetyltransferase n=1 Tax=Paraglaciecola arctica BSs20135 TaxID=493475 RepID=K6Z3A4_9ALTE|nr:chloramphenicol acetyltransferase [Paraglaciecola arctica]GAC17910.1 chloramphenicol O-acetyltransferase [Paraglaciecola arctica BSs20135]
MKKIELSSWHRKEHFEFYTSFKQPFFNVCGTVDVTKPLNYCKENQLSFFICSLFLLGYTANQIEPFRLRINNNEVDIHDELEISCTVLNNDESFSFCEFGGCKNFDIFYQRATQQLAQVKNGYKSLTSSNNIDNKIFCSVLPWLHFTSFSHAQKQDEHDSVPRIVMGKYKKNHNEIAMPVSVEVHHALVDGLHVGQYFEKLQQNFDDFFDQ